MVYGWFACPYGIIQYPLRTRSCVVTPVGNLFHTVPVGNVSEPYAGFAFTTIAQPSPSNWFCIMDYGSGQRPPAPAAYQAPPLPCRCCRGSVRHVDTPGFCGTPAPATVPFQHLPPTPARGLPPSVLVLACLLAWNWFYRFLVALF